MKLESENNMPRNFNSDEGIESSRTDSGIGTSEQSELQVIVPSTESQREIWTSVKMGLEANLAFNQPVYLRFKGVLDVGALQAAVQAVVDRHESFRAFFNMDGTKFCILKKITLDIPVIDLSQSNEKEELLQALFINEAEQPFSLEQVPLFRAQIVKMASEDHLLIITAHHIVCDGWTFAILLKDIAQLYQSKPSELALVDPFSRYATMLEERSETSDYAKDEEYWKSVFNTVPLNLDLPTDRPRPFYKTYPSKREDYLLDKQLVTDVKKVGAKLGCSFFQTLLATFEVLVHRLSGQNDIVLGIMAAGQSSSNQMNLAGHCVFNLPLRVVVDDTLPFNQFLKKVKSALLDAYDHQQYTYGSLLSHLKIPRDSSRLPLCSIIFNIDQTLDANKLGFKDMDVFFDSIHKNYETFELFVNAVERDGAMILEVQYNTDLFDELTIKHYMSCFEVLLREISTDPGKEIARLPLLSKSDQQKIIVDWNQTEAAFPLDATLHSLFSAQAERTPNDIAVEFEWDIGLTYRQLEEKSNQLAHHLQSHGIVPGALIGVYVDRSIDMMVTVLAIHKSGAAYVPLDPAYPQDRIGFMIRDSKLNMIISQSWLVSSLPEHQAQIIVIDNDVQVVSTLPKTPVNTQMTPEGPAYVIYTSGSTGLPKGVSVQHKGVTNLLTSLTQKLEMTSKDVWLAVTTLSFDIAIVELYLPLVNGAKTVIASRETSKDSRALLNLLKKTKATIMQATPSTWRLLLSNGWDNAEWLGKKFKILSGGEAMQADLAHELLKRVDRFWNGYGPTETTVYSMNARIEDDKKISIGRPIDNTQIYILDKFLEPVPVGVSGELYIGGVGVSSGYLGRPELNTERFIENPYFNPFAQVLSPRLYKTGDLVRFLSDGRVEYIGRNDHQVKVRGYRIELGEIETSIGKHPSVQQAIVMVREFNPGDDRLVAYAVLKSGQTLTRDVLREHLRQTLPEFMVPQFLVTMDSFPQTENGKVDRKALPFPSEVVETTSKTEISAKPKTEMEALITKIWSDLLKIDSIEPHDNFFNLGGHSLLSMQFISRLEKEKGIRLNPRIILVNTLAQIAQQISGGIDVDNRNLILNETKPAKGILTKLRDFLNKDNSSHIEKKQKHELHKRGSKQHHLLASIKQDFLWKTDQKYPHHTFYNSPTAFSIKGRLNLAALQKSFKELVSRHEILRTILINSKGTVEQKVLSVDDPSIMKIIEQNIDEAQLLETLNNQAHTVFKLDKGPLILVNLYTLSPNDHVLFLMTHHCIWDGWSFDIFLNEMNSLYESFSNNNPISLKPLEIQYADYALWQREELNGAKMADDERFWLNQFTNSIPKLELPQMKKLQSNADFKGDSYNIAVSKEDMDSLTAMGLKEGVTLSVVLMTAYYALLHAYSGQKDLIIGLPVLGRDEKSVQNIIGCFVNTLPIRICVSNELATFSDILNQVQEHIYEAYRHQNIPIEFLHHRIKKLHPQLGDFLTQTFFSFQDASQRATRLGPLELEQIALHSGEVSQDLSLWFKASAKGLVGAIDYRTSLFDADTITQMAADYKSLLKMIIANPNTPLRELNFKHSPSSSVQTEPMADLNDEHLPMTRTINPFYFKSMGKNIFGIYQPARSKTIRDTAVLICYPIGQEYNRAHWALQQLGDRLVKDGFPIMRFDYFATGDSQGETIEGNLEQWKNDVVSAVNKLKTLSGFSKISIVGLRFGATLATLATNNTLEIEDLILCDPVLQGKNYLDDVRSQHSTIFSQYKQSVTSINALEELEGLLGYPYSKNLLSDIDSVDLLQSKPHLGAKNIYVLSSDHMMDKHQFCTPLHSEIVYHSLHEDFKWNNHDYAYFRLISPNLIQSIVSALLGRLK